MLTGEKGASDGDRPLDAASATLHTFELCDADELYLTTHRDVVANYTAPERYVVAHRYNTSSTNRKSMLAVVSWEPYVASLPLSPQP